MKRFLLAIAFAVSFFTAGAQTNSYGGSYTTTGTYPVYATKLDTVTNTGTDTFKLAIGVKPQSITFQQNILKISGTPGGTVTEYGTIDGVNYAVITSYAVTAASLSVPQTTVTVNNTGFGGNPYTNYMWVWTGTGTMVGSWQGYLLVR